MVGAAFSFAVMSLLVKVVGQRLPTMEVVFVRSVVTLALSWGMLRVRGKPVWGVNRPLLLLRGGIGFLALSCFYYAVIHLPLADATVIQYTNPVFTAVLAAIFLKERMGSREVGLGCLSLAGVVIMARPAFLFGGAGAGLDPMAVGIALAGAVLSGASYTLVRQLGRTDGSLVIVFYFSLVSVVASLPLMLPAFQAPSPMEWALLLGIGMSTQAGHTLLNVGLRRERAGRAMAVAYLQIVFAAAVAFLVLREVPGPASWVGAGIIVVSTVLLSGAASAPVMPGGGGRSREE